MQYEYAFDPQGDSTAAKLVRMVGKGKRVLELGSGPGVISRVLSEQNGCRVTAVEQDPRSAAKAAAWAEQVVVADLEDSAWSDSLTGSFDAILAADVLEHLRDPGMTLRQLNGWLVDGGELIVSIPNVGHAGVIAQLLVGSFDYRETGILDRTHLRFFTWMTFEKLLNEQGFEAVERECVCASGAHEHFIDYWQRLPEAARSLLSGHPTASVFQYVLKARKSAAPARLEVADAENLTRWAGGQV